MALRKRPMFATVMALGLLTVNGCGQLPTAPRLDASGGAAGSAVSGGLVADPGGIDVGPPAGGSGVPPAGSPSLEATTGVIGEMGGSVQLKDVSVIVPKNAFPGAATIQVTKPDSTRREVHLEITPASKNHFDVPVRLEFDVAGSGEDPRMMVIRWHDMAENQWVDIPTTTDPVTGKVWADLAHFSEYRCVNEVKGRAGW
jgi:hypothetical protein